MPLQEEIKSLEFEVVGILPQHLKRGRPLRLSKRAFIRICWWIERGRSATDACKVEGIAYRTWRKHICRNERLQKRLREAEATRLDVWRKAALQTIVEAGEKNWVACAWLLERSAPERWSLKNISRAEESPEQALCNKVSLEQLVENAKLAAEIAANPPPALTVQESAFSAPEVVES